MEYQPGVCNIGRAEVLKRRRLGAVGLLVTAGALLAGIVSGSVLVDIGLILGLVMVFEGLLQARLRFCAGFAQQGVYDVSPEGDQRQQVTGQDARRADVLMAMKVHLATFLGTVLVYLAVTGLPGPI